VKCHEQSDAVEKIDKVDTSDASTVECHGLNDHKEPLESDEVTEAKWDASIK